MDPDPALGVSDDRRDEETNLLDLLLVLARNTKLIRNIILVFTIGGLVLAVLADYEYTATAQVIREAESEGGVGMGALSALRGFGLNLGGSTVGLTPEAYPDIVTGREVRLAVVRDTFFFGDVGLQMSFVDYQASTDSGLASIIATIKKYTIGLPGLLIRTFKGNQTTLPPGSSQQVYPTVEEEAAMRAIAGLITTGVDVETGLMSLSVTTGSASLSAQITQSFLTHLSRRISEIRSEKARQNLQFIEARFREAERELEQVERELARFLDRNRNPQTAQLQTELDRLRRNVTFKSQLYSELQTQVTQAEIELQRSLPVLTILEEPVPPVIPSGPRRTLMVLFSIVLGFFVAFVVAFLRSVFEKLPADREDHAKWDEIKHAFTPSWLKRANRPTTR